MSTTPRGEADSPDGAASADLDRLRNDLDVALAAARDAELQAGRLRGELAEMRVQLGRARQEQEWALTGRPRRTMRTITWLRVLAERADQAVRRRLQGLRRQ